LNRLYKEGYIFYKIEKGGGVVACKNTIILVVDSVGARRALAQALQDYGYEGQTLETGDGQIALEIFCQDKVDLVISDRERPALDDIELFTVVDSKKAHSKPSSFSWPRQSRSGKRLKASLKQNQTVSLSKKFCNNQTVRYSRKGRR
jgi:CheY-like chemotaxis protein